MVRATYHNNCVNYRILYILQQIYLVILFFLFMSYPVSKIANKIIISLTNVECGEVITNLKLQKLLYYTQGFNLAIFDYALFEEPIEAWRYGPVVPVVYHKFKEHGYLGINCENIVDDLELDEIEEIIFNQVLEEYGKFSALKLMNMTHQEKPWCEAYNNRNDKTISEKTMQSFFKNLIDE